MQYKRLVTEGQIPVLGLGTWLIGGGQEPDYTDDKNAISTIKNAIHLGYTHIDTAEMYGGGHTEELVGKAIQDFSRKEIFVTTKVRNTKLRYNDVLQSVKESLHRLQTNYIDLLLIHAPSNTIPISETLRAFDSLVEAKLVKYIGVSNFQVDQLIEAQQHTKNKIVANQIEYSLLTRNTGRYAENKDMETKTIPYCQQNNIIIIAERPIERGLLLKSHPLLDKLEVKYNKTKAQIAINWLISKQNVVTIPKSTNEKRLMENLGALGWKMDKEDTKLLDEAQFVS
ncbi:MAG: aldo/keto reductase [Candidatus Magasanikbacteria bacterium CG11_big_fil_rev_8_21_14_0_20_39_34]|uniref:Aldo/keto reductase n=1 Tax=Candidatus Magasanikbacteria bacterium CG11_big_fil_rev_8_21_14_0_20_39_34 TaxID=1974653 RepID=A0A2H0N6P2_9BACT|nr:MAG: aldo/keto reductase [Candidatus Magasanikbacteria bacterium CG11_big_fil_rev_8_21_14_0_20_39_34]